MNISYKLTLEETLKELKGCPHIVIYNGLGTRIIAAMDYNFDTNSLIEIIYENGAIMEVSTNMRDFTLAEIINIKIQEMINLASTNRQLHMVINYPEYNNKEKEED